MFDHTFRPVIFPYGAVMVIILFPDTVCCRDKLAVYKVPKIIEFRDELPKTLVGKVDKKALRGENENKYSSRLHGT